MGFKAAAVFGTSSCGGQLIHRRRVVQNISHPYCIAIRLEALLLTLMIPICYSGKQIKGKKYHMGIPGYVNAININYSYI